MAILVIFGGLTIHNLQDRLRLTRGSTVLYLRPFISLPDVSIPHVKHKGLSAYGRHTH